jgi:hypothetical protein
LPWPGISWPWRFLDGIDESAAASLATSIPRFRDRPKNGT